MRTEPKPGFPSQRHPPGPPRVPRISLGRALLRVGTISLVLVVLVLAGLSVQMARGHDPALGAKLGRSSASSLTAQVPGPAPAPAGVEQAAVVQAPAPAPAPAPVQTSTS